MFPNAAAARDYICEMIGQLKQVLPGVMLSLYTGRTVFSAGHSRISLVLVHELTWTG